MLNEEWNEIRQRYAKLFMYENVFYELCYFFQNDVCHRDVHACFIIRRRSLISSAGYTR